MPTRRLVPDEKPQEALPSDLEFLAEATRRMSGMRDPRQLLRTAGRLAVPRLADFAIVVLVEGDASLRRLEAVHRAAEGQEVLEALLRENPLAVRRGTVLGQVVETGEALFIPTITDDLLRTQADSQTHLARLRALRPRSAFALPLRADGRVVGVLALSRDADSQQPYDDASRALAEEYAGRAGAAFSNALLHEARENALRAERATQDRLSLLAEAAATLVAEDEPESLLDAILGLSKRIIEADAYALWRRDPRSRRWSILASRGLSADYRANVGNAMAHTDAPHAPLLIEDVRTHPLMEKHADLQEKEGIRSMALFPLRAPPTLEGTLVFYYSSPHGFDQTEARLGGVLASLATNALSQADLREARERERRRRAESEARFRAAFEQASLGFVLLREDGRVDEANPAFGAMLGYGPHELDGRPFSELVHAAERADSEAARLAMDEDSKPRERQRRLLHRDGHTVHVSVRASLLRSTDEKGARHLALVEDVTERERAREREREHVRVMETLHRVNIHLAAQLELEPLVQEATDAATSLTGAAFGAFFDNAEDARGEQYALCTISGAPGEASGRFPMPRSAPLLAPTFRGEGVVRLDDLSTSDHYGTRAPHHGTPEYHLPMRSYLAVPVVSSTGRVHGGLFFGHTEPARFDETAERFAVGIAAQAAIALDNAHLYRAAKESEERFRMLAETVPQLVWTARQDGTLDYVNERWEEYTGQSDGQWADGGCRMTVHPEDVVRVEGLWAQCVSTLAPFESVHRIRRHDGAQRWHLVKATPMRAPDGTVARWFGTCTDIHDQKLGEEELSRVRAQLTHSEKLSALGSLVSGVAHEIRTPLTYLANCLYLLERAAERMAEELPPERAAQAKGRMESYLRESHDAVDRINRLVSDLRRYVKPRRAERAPTRLDEAARDAVNLFRATHRPDIKLVEGLDETPPLELDRIQMQQVVLNLLENALDAQPRDSVVHVRTRPTPDGGAVLEVEDRAGGIPDDVRTRMFDPFFTTKEEGTGLGLSIVRRIVEDHGGRIDCESEMGKGTRFVVHLPTAHAP